ncbi:MAG TPA: SDR family NAD(P)-dependent oxidoreductase, partial [Firmicutes bacterium]|nr:SDR family NAD(P)-dependent oxidoreductase [Bacillota bacterium]
MLLKGKTAVVTGGSRGIGAAIAEKFSENGANVAVLYAGAGERAAEVVAKAQAFGVHAAAYKCDVADFAQVEAVFKQIGEEFGRIDILVNNAGVTRDKLLLQMTEEDFDRV